MVGPADLGWQKYHMSEEMMMTRQEARQDHKDSEGDPQIRAHRRPRARQLAMGRQFVAVQKADQGGLGPRASGSTSALGGPVPSARFM